MKIKLIKRIMLISIFLLLIFSTISYGIMPILYYEYECVDYIMAVFLCIMIILQYLIPLVFFTVMTIIAINKNKGNKKKILLAVFKYLFIGIFMIYAIIGIGNLIINVNAYLKEDHEIKKNRNVDYNGRIVYFIGE